MVSERTPKHDWDQVIDAALTVRGNLGTVYSRFHQYSYGNMLRLMMQGAREPCASYKRYQAMGRQVVKGAKGLEVIRPYTAVKKNDDDEVEATFTRFVPVRGAFKLSDTVGADPPPPPEIPDWSFDTALQRLGIVEVPYEWMDGNCQGYARGNEIAVSPVAVFPVKTRTHEMAHHVAGHTDGNRIVEYPQPRGVREFVAEMSAHLVLTELELMDEQQASVSRACLQGWTADERPPEKAIRDVFSVTERILEAGRPEELVLAPEVA